jgi:hypothetical protein
LMCCRCAVQNRRVFVAFDQVFDWRCMYAAHGRAVSVVAALLHTRLLLLLVSA